MGHQLQIETTLALNFESIFVKAPYDNEIPDSFLVFDADEKLEVIEEYLA